MTNPKDDFEKARDEALERYYVEQCEQGEINSRHMDGCDGGFHAGANWAREYLDKKLHLTMPKIVEGIVQKENAELKEELEETKAENKDFEEQLDIMDGLYSLLKKKEQELADKTAALEKIANRYAGLNIKMPRERIARETLAKWEKK